MYKIFMLLLLFTTSIVANDKTDTLQKQLEELEQKVDLLQQSINQNKTTFSQQEYLPDIAFVFNMSAVYRDVNNSAY